MRAGVRPESPVRVQTGSRRDLAVINLSQENKKKIKGKDKINFWWVTVHRIKPFIHVRSYESPC